MTIRPHMVTRAGGWDLQWILSGSCEQQPQQGDFELGAWDRCGDATSSRSRPHPAWQLSRSHPQPLGDLLTTSLVILVNEGEERAIECLDSSTLAHLSPGSSRHRWRGRRRRSQRSQMRRRQAVGCLGSTPRSRTAASRVAAEDGDLANI